MADGGVAETDAATGVLVAVAVGMLVAGITEGVEVAVDSGTIVGVAVTTTVTSMITGGIGDAGSTGTALGCESSLETTASPPHAKNASALSTLATTKSFALVGVSVMVMTMVMVVSVAVVSMIMRVVVSVVHHRWRRNVIVSVSVGRIHSSSGVNRVISERDAFEIAWRTTHRVGLSESNIMRCFTFEDEVCGLAGGK